MLTDCDVRVRKEETASGLEFSKYLKQDRLWEDRPAGAQSHT